MHTMAWNTVVMSGPVLLVTTWNCYKLQKQKLLVLQLLPLEPLAHCRNVASLSLFYKINMVVVHVNWLSLFHVLILEGGLYIILIDCMICAPPFLDVTRMSMSTVSFPTQLDSGILFL